VTPFLKQCQNGLNGALAGALLRASGTGGSAVPPAPPTTLPQPKTERTKMSNKTLAALGAVMALAAGYTSAEPLGTAFLYQGHLTAGMSAANGAYDFQFAIYDAASGANLVAGPLTRSLIGVTNGLFTSTLDFGSGAFAGTACWLEIAVRPNGGGAFTPLSPRQPLLPTPYALRATTAGSAVAYAGVVADGQLSANIPRLSGGASFAGAVSATSLSGNGAGLTSLNADNLNAGTLSMARLADNSIPAAKLRSDVASLANVSGGRVINQGANVIVPGSGTPIDNTKFSGLGFQFNPYSGEGAIMSSWDDGFGFLSFYTTAGPGKPLTRRMVIDEYGQVGIGKNPSALLDVAGTARSINLVADATGTNGGTLAAGLSFGPSSGEGIGSKRTAGGNQFGLDFYTSYSTRMSLSQDGSLWLHGNTAYLRGVGDTSHGLGYFGGSKLFAGQSPDGVVLFGYNGGALGSDQSGTQHIALSWRPNGRVGIGTDAPQSLLHVNGEATVSVLTITGGADLAEPFEMASPGIPKGAVVIIDEEHPGKLKLSDHTYDTRVAGVVSGANGIQPGLTLRQEGVLEGAHQVALTGRVYVQAEAVHGPIQPGDLLTTSDVPGHAMKVTEPARAQGAILGKAMTGLKQGQGFILVLVTLQ
jgi:hypothetical protein